MKNYTKLLLMVLLLFSVKTYSIPKLNSFPTATATIFIDFDGHTVTGSGWNGGNTLFCAPAPLTDFQMTEIFNRVSEDYRPFNINITTDSTKFLSAPLNRRIRIIVTPTSGWCPGVGGVAYIGSFIWGDDTPAFVFTDRLANSPKYIGECVSHESGHTVGLSHQSSYNASCTLTEQYATGAGVGETGWAPIMGNSYYKNMTGWNFGPTPSGCNYVQDNLTIISSQNGFTYRADDFSEALDGSARNLNATAFSIEGVIATNIDKDAFKYDINENSTIHFEATPFRLNAANTGSNLDVQVDLYNESNVLIRSYAPVNKMDVVIDTVLNEGVYYFVISGTGNMNTGDYGSLGSYTISGFRGALPIRSISLTGSDDSNRHSLRWNIIADEPIKEQILEVSLNGTVFTPLTAVDVSFNKYEYLPGKHGTIYYRLKATSVIDQVAYSNTLALSTGKDNKLFSVSTMVQNEIIINAPGNYEYLLTDANGRSIMKGRGISGINRIDMTRFASGLYVIRFLNQTIKQTERIIKQ